MYGLRRNPDMPTQYEERPRRRQGTSLVSLAYASLLFIGYLRDMMRT